MRTTSTLFAALVALSLLALSTQTHAQDATPRPAVAPVRHLAPLGRISLSLSAMSLWRADRAFRAFGDNPSAAPELTLGLVVAEPDPHFSLATELAVRHEETDQVLLQAATARLHVDVASAALVLRWEPLKWLTPFVRASIGVEHHGAEIATLSGDGFALVGSAGAGVEVYLPLGLGVTDRAGARAEAGLGVFVEGGAVFGSRDVVQVSPRTPPDELPSDVIHTTPVRVGAFDQTAGYVRLGIVVRF